MKTTVLVAAFGAALALGPPAAAFDTPLQVDVEIAMPSGKGGARRFETLIAPGAARLRGVVRNQRDGLTTRIDLDFDYRVPRDVIALDEIIDGIEVSTEQETAVFGSPPSTPTT